MNKTKKICYLAVLTALYIVLSTFLKFYIGVGHIQIDLGYIAFAVALCEFGVAGAAVGILGCAIESILFTTYGFSLSWAVANAIIGIGCGLVFSKTRTLWLRVLSIILFTALGMVVAKTVIECYLYAIPLAVKLPKSIAAFAVDTIAMCFGLGLYDILNRRKNTKSKVVSVKRGYWIGDEFENEGSDVRCSVCYCYARKRHNFCPHCGTSMTEGDEFMWEDKARPKTESAHSAKT